MELKQNPDTARIPVVLMWSSFMDVDQAKILESRADGRLENLSMQMDCVKLFWT